MSNDGNWNFTVTVITNHQALRLSGFLNTFNPSSFLDASDEGIRDLGRALLSSESPVKNSSRYEDVSIGYFDIPRK